MDSNEDLPWYAWLAIGAGVLLDILLVVVYLCYKLRCCCWSQPKEETAPRRRAWHSGRDNVSGDGPASLEAGIGFGSLLGSEPVAVSSRSNGGSQSLAAAAPKIGFWHEAENYTTRGAFVKPAITSDHVDKPTIRTVSSYMNNAATSGRVNKNTSSGYVNKSTTRGHVNKNMTSVYTYRTAFIDNVDEIPVHDDYVDELHVHDNVDNMDYDEIPVHEDSYEDDSYDEERFKTLDLHGFKTADAVKLVKEHINKVPDGFGSVHIITGRGLHSEGGIPSIRPAVEGILNARNMRYERRSKGGMLRVLR